MTNRSFRTFTARRSIEVQKSSLALITVTVMLGTLMAVIDTSIVNVALDTMAGNLGASVDEIGWVTTGYILSQVIVMPLNGWLTARFGRRNFYAASLVVFTAASFLCGTATNVWLLVFYRLIQGIGGGALQPTAQAILMESYPHDRRPAAIAIFGIGAMVGPAIGPVLGGWFIDNYSWPLIFYVNVPIGVITFVMTMLYIRTPAYVKRDDSPIDVVALALLAAGLGSLQYVLEQGQRLDWFSSNLIVSLTLISIVAITAFVIRELRDATPLVDLRVFASQAFSAGNVITVISGFGLYGTGLILPLFLQNVLGFTPTDAGLALVPGAIATMLSLPLASRAIRVADPRVLIAVGLGIFAAGAWWMGALNQDAGYWDVFWPRALQGFALGFLFVPLSTATLSEVPNARMASATGIYTLIRQIGGSFGIAVLLFLQTRFEDTAYAGIASSVTLANANIAHAVQHDGLSPIQLWGMVTVNATVISYDMVLRLCGIVFACAIPVVLLLRAKIRSGQPVEVVLE
jgi:MFS transporter, DHA2 family, multidrug resistance protein